MVEAGGEEVEAVGEGEFVGDLGGALGEEGLGEVPEGDAGEDEGGAEGDDGPRGENHF